ncbi:MAG: translocation protein sec66 [Amphiamblys sp. WSBS2006]|nr:MAG: translocation protein sec66 [Amphiamblys sp. WSBS2006]
MVDETGGVFSGLAMFAIYFVLLCVGGYFLRSVVRTKRREDVSFFGENIERKEYMLGLEEGVGEVRQKVLLMRWGMGCVRRIWTLDDEKERIEKLSYIGCVGDELMWQLETAENDIEVEYFDIKAEANAFRPGWEKTIYKEASALVHKESEKKKKSKS